MSCTVQQDEVPKADEIWMQQVAARRCAGVRSRRKQGTAATIHSCHSRVQCQCQWFTSGSLQCLQWCDRSCSGRGRRAQAAGRKLKRQVPLEVPGTAFLYRYELGTLPAVASEPCSARRQAWRDVDGVNGVLSRPRRRLSKWWWSWWWLEAWP